MKYHFKIHQEDIGFSAACIELEGCITQGDTIEELEENMKEALNTYVDEPEASKYLAPLPNTALRPSKTVVAVSLDPQVAFAFMVRYSRIKHGMTQRQAAREMGLNDIYNYQRLESRKCNPTLKTISRIKRIFPEFSVDLALSY